MGIEPTYAAWEAAVLPLNYTRSLWARFYNMPPEFSPGPPPTLGRSSLKTVHWTVLLGFAQPLQTR